MGFWRSLYYLLDIEYIGEAEQKQIEKQKRQKYLMCEQIKKSNMKLKHTSLIDKILNNSIKKKNGKKRQRN